MKSKILKIFLILLFFTLYTLCFILYKLYAQEARQQSIIVNGDTVEYSTDAKEVTASGNVEIIYKGARLTCKKITVNTQTKDVVAEGEVRLEDERGVIEGEKIIYNFNTKTGVIINSGFRSNPYFGKTEKIQRVSEDEFLAIRGYVTTCSFDNPHYRIKSRKVDFFPGDKIQTKDATFYVGEIPLLYLPQYDHNLKDPLMHVQLMPGESKDWGTYLLTAWKYRLSDNVGGRIYFDYRNKLGIAEGFGANYDTHQYGQGDLKFYYTQERLSSHPANEPGEFQRYLLRLRHRWDIDERTKLISEYYKIGDEKRKLLGNTNNFLKDYFFREYEKDSQPLSYILLSRSFDNSSVNFLVQKRTNRWFDQIEKTPEIQYSLPDYRLFEGVPIYLENSSSFGQLNKKVDPLGYTENVTRLDTKNKFSLPMKLGFLRVSPFVADQETVYDKGADGKSLPIRTIFYTGVDTSTKFFRLYDVKTKILGMDINGLRHIITPSIGYSYNHKPSVSSLKIKQIDAIDAIATNNSLALELSNKLQTKRNDQSVDLVDLRLSSAYAFYSVDPATNNKSKSSFSDLLIDLKLIPYSWLRIESDATYSNDRNYFSDANYDINFDFGKERSFGIGQRYQRKGGNEITTSFTWRLNPKWKFSAYQRYNIGRDLTLIRGLLEQEYTISRDLHCWIMDITYNVKKDGGHAIWCAFRLKAFPETEFGFNQSYNGPKSGSQSSP